MRIRGYVMKSATVTNPNTQSSTKNVPVLMDVLIEKRLKRQSNQLSQSAPLNSQLTNQLRELRKANAALQLKNQKTQRYAERVQADRDEFRKQVIRLLHRSKLLEQQLEEQHKPTWNDKLSLESIKSKASNAKVIKDHCLAFLQTSYTITLQITKKIAKKIKEVIDNRNARRLESQGNNSNKSTNKGLNKQQYHSKKEVERQHKTVNKHALKKVIKHEYIEI